MAYKAFPVTLLIFLLYYKEMQRFFKQISHPASPASWNMAVDHSLMESDSAWIRFYQWEKPSISLGYFQPLTEINMPFIQAQGNRMALVRRITGGKAVLHQHEWTYSISAPVSYFPGHLRDSYQIIAKGLQLGLQELGIDCEMVERTPEKLEGGNCFQVPGWYEIVHRGNKLIGSAQTRRRGRLLQHGSLLLDKDIPLIQSAFMQDPAERLQSVSLKEICGGIPEGRKVVQALSEGLQESLQCTVERSELPANLSARIRELEKSRYSLIGSATPRENWE